MDMGSRGLLGVHERSDQAELDAHLDGALRFVAAAAVLSFAAAPAVLAVHDEGLFELDGNPSPTTPRRRRPATTGTAIPARPATVRSSSRTTSASPRRHLHRRRLEGRPEHDPAGSGRSAASRTRTTSSTRSPLSYEKSGHTFVYFGLDRFANNGDAFTRLLVLQERHLQDGCRTASRRPTRSATCSSRPTSPTAAPPRRSTSTSGSAAAATPTAPSTSSRSGQICTGAPVNDKACAVTNSAPINPVLAVH